MKPNTYLKSNFHCIKAVGVLVLLIGFCGHSRGQNIASTDIGVNWIGANNSYTQPINGSASANALQYRKISTTVADPVDGRGQWWCTLYAHPTSGDVINQDMPGGPGNGFLFSSGDAAGDPGTTTNTWGWPTDTSFAVNAVSSIQSSSYGPVNDVGLRMSQQGYYTFSLLDSGLDRNSNMYVGYTTNAPITFTHNPALHQFILNDRKTVLLAKLSATPSAQEKIYVRYKTGTNDFSSGTSFISAAARISNDSAIVILPPQAISSTVFYYFFSSTLSQSELNALPESSKSLACLRYNDNSGTNYNIVIPAAAVLYTHNFNTAPTANANYTVVPNTFNANFTAGSSVFSCPAFFATSPAQKQGAIGSSLSPNILIPTNGSTTVTLKFNVKANFYASFTGLTFWASTNVNNNLAISSITINGNTAGTNITVPTNATTETITQNITNCNNLTGAITVILTITNTNASAASFFLDDFSISGNTGNFPAFLGYTWLGTTNSSWTTTSNWAPAGNPGANDNVIIAALPTLNITGAQSVKNLTLAGTGTLQMASGSSLSIGGTFNYESSATYNFNCNSTINFTSPSLITIPALQYGHLNISGGPRQLSSGITTGICGNFTPTASSFSALESMVTFNGSSGQSIQTNPASFQKLVIANQFAAVSSNVPLTITNGGSLTVNPSAQLNTGTNALTLSGTATAAINGTISTSGNFSNVDASNFSINATGIFNYNATRSGMADLGAIPVATWNSGSTLLVSGLTNPASGSWFTSGMDQSFSNLIWNTPNLTTNPQLSGPLTINNTLTITSTGSSSLVIAGNTDNSVTTNNLTVTGGTIDFGNGTGTGVIFCSGTFNHSAGYLTYTGSSDLHAVYFNGTGLQNITGNAFAYNDVNLVFDNTAGFNITTNALVLNRAIIRNGSLSGAGQLTFQSIGDLVYDVTADRTVSSTEWSTTSPPDDVQVNNGITLTLDASHEANQLLLNNALVNLAASNLLLTDSDGVVAVSPFSATNMVITAGAGKLGINLPTATFPFSVIYPVGVNTYNPVSYTFSANNTARALYVGFKESTHPSLVSADYLANRYWSTDLSTNVGTYSYSVNYPFQPGDLVGNAANILLSRYNGSIWSSIAGSTYTNPALGSGNVNESTASLETADWCGSAGTAPGVYNWNFPASGSWTSAANWTPNGVPNNGDAVYFSGAGNTTVTNVPTGISLTRLSITGGGTVTLQAATNGTLNVSGTLDPELTIDAASTLVLGGTKAITLNVSGGSSGSVYGKIRLRDAAHSLTATDAGALVFQSGSYFAAGVLNTTTYNGYPFGATGTNYSVVFKSGAILEQFDGLDPFGQTSANKKVLFETGSTYKYAHNSTTTSKSPFLSGRDYDIYEYNSTQNLSQTGTSPFTVRNLSINSGTLNVNLTQSYTRITGNLSMAAGTNLNFAPADVGSLEFSGTTTQIISGSGNLTLGNTLLTTIKTGATVQLQKNITNNGRIDVNGIMDAGAYQIQGTGTASRVSVNAGSVFISGSANGLNGTGASGSITTTYRDFSSGASYVLTGSGSMGDFLDWTYPTSSAADSLAVNSPGTVTYGGSASFIYLNKLALLSGSFAPTGGTFIQISATGKVISTGGRMAAGTSGGNVTITGTLSPGTPVTGNPQFYNLTVNGGVDFQDNGTVNGTLQLNSGAIVYTAPSYGTSSRLIYNMGGTYNRSVEWNQLTPWGPGYPNNVTIQNGTALKMGVNPVTNLEMGGDLRVGASANTGSLSMDALSVPLKVNGSVTIGATFNSNNSKLILSTVAGGDVRIGKSFVRFGVVANDVTSNAGTIIFTGSGNDSLSYVQTSAPYLAGPQTLARLSMQKTGGDLTLKTTTLTLTNTLNLQNGVINTSTTNSLTISTSGTVTGTPSNSSYVNGPLIRTTNTTNLYLFPIGSSAASGSNKYRPVTITPAVNTNCNFTGQYLPAIPTPNNTNQTGAKLMAIDNTGTWNISRSAAVNARLSLGYRDPGNNWIDKTGALVSPYSTSSAAAIQYNQSAYPGNWALTADTTSSTYFKMERLVSDEDFVYTKAAMDVSAGRFGIGLLYPPSPKVTSVTPSSAYTGSVVTITGSNFAVLTSVTIGGVAPASYTVDNANQITAIVGTGASGSVAVSNAFGTGTVSGFSYLGYISNNNGDWSSNSTWLGNGVPPNATTTDITIANDVTPTPTVQVSKLTVNPAGQLTITEGTTLTVNTASQNNGIINVNGTLAAAVNYTNSGTIQGSSGSTGNIQINQGGSFSGNNILYDASLTNLTFNNSAGQYSVPNSAAYWPAASGPSTVNVSGAGGTRLQSGTVRTITDLNLSAAFDIQSAGLLTVNGTLQINNAGGILTGNAPLYGASSSLVYNSGGSYSRRLEWSGTTGNPGFPNDVIIQNNTTLVAGGVGGVYTATAFNAGRDVTIANGSGLQMNGFNMTVPLKVGRDLAINGTLTGSGAANGDINVTGNWTRNAGGIYTHNNRMVSFDGASGSAITATGGETFGSLTINKSSPSITVTLSNPVTVQNQLGLISGIVNSTSANLLTVSSANAAAISGGSGNSFVNGPIRRYTAIVAGNYLFPTGDLASNLYRPVTLTTINGMAVGDHFTGQYFNAAPPSSGNDFFLSSLTGIEKNEYWQLDRTAGVATGSVSMDYSNPGVNNWRAADGTTLSPCATCYVAIVKRSISSGVGNWDFSADPNSLDNALPTPEYRLHTDNGPIGSEAFSSFSPFTFGFFYNVTLPVRLTAFNGTLSGQNGLLAWAIANVQDLKGFELQYSTDGHSFNKLTYVDNTGKTDYTYLHRSLQSGANFYRLKVLDKSGSSFYSNVVVLTTGRIQTQITGLRETIVTSRIIPMIISASNQRVRATLVDGSGRIINNYETGIQSGPNEWVINTPLLTQGFYLLHVTTADGVEKTLKLIKN